MNTISGRAIVTYGRSLISLVIAHSLAKRGVEVITCDSVGMTTTSFSKYVADSFIHDDMEEDEDAYIASLIEHVKAHKPDDQRPYILIPAFRDAKILAKYENRLAPLIQLASPSLKAMDAVDPKHHLMNTLRGREITHPATFHPANEAEIDDALSAVTYPALIKAVDEVGGRGIDFFDDAASLRKSALERMKTEMPPPIIQAGIDGEDYCFCALYQDGDLKAHMAYKNLQNMPVDGGSGVVRETVDDTPFLKGANALMKDLNWTGVAEIDFRWTGRASDPAYLIEVNPRFWAGLFQSVESDIDFPWLLYHLFAYGRVPSVDEADIGTTTKLPGLWMAGAIKDAFDTDSDMELARQAYQRAKSEARDGNIGAAFDNLTTAFAKALSFDEGMDVIRRQYRSAKQAKSEFSLAEDPMTSLGVFFILSHLVRHGKLPPEVKF